MQKDKTIVEKKVENNIVLVQRYLSINVIQGLI